MKVCVLTSYRGVAGFVGVPRVVRVSAKVYLRLPTQEAGSREQEAGSRNSSNHSAGILHGVEIFGGISHQWRTRDDAFEADVQGSRGCSAEPLPSFCQIHVSGRRYYFSTRTQYTVHRTQNAGRSRDTTVRVGLRHLVGRPHGLLHVPPSGPGIGSSLFLSSMWRPPFISPPQSDLPPAYRTNTSSISFHHLRPSQHGPLSARGVESHYLGILGN